ncbi:MAG TPA: UvrD-helicase domain-containing protein [Bacilli bacterium]|jgi:DNA helicase-2/ATP-dependent DNA helicase PcrA|nr:UvrD-helicase domain-containing protein [Acholeplasmataceae bacterium]HNZ77514.1 UvrD-helicase domain-containing protein [Bacilli bacterium]HOH61385.1 UvrD-helicase domain-containing protein [Bacilli bacterium]HPB49367.1 UvrD-helicase domain-containing protein [Bacilli bacterium]HPM14992.1 UvrD-helicase domain-containing protein [Bacilli bacterium]
MLSNLNEEQKKTVLAYSGPVMVSAGAGSGKTRALTFRIAYMVKEKGINPANILAITFTNKATNEMRERLINLVGPEIYDATISTFHALCARILRKEIPVLGYSRTFSIIDEEEQLKIITDVLKENNEEKRKAKHIQKAINYNKCFGIEKIDNPLENKIFKLYEDKMKSLNLLDFEDLLLKTKEIFTNFPQTLQKYQDRFHYVLCDEFQDTSLIQYEIIKMLTEKSRNLFVVGDDDQSIYSFRGTNYENMSQFKRDFPEHQIFYLTENYRSTQTILDGCNKLIKNNENREPKELFSRNKGKEDDVIIVQTESEKDEVNYVLDAVRSLKTTTTPWTDFAVLYRNSVILRNFELGFIKMGIPYRVFGGVSYLKRREVKDIIAYLKLIINDNDIHSFKRIINVPTRGIGEVTIGKIEAICKEDKVQLFEALKASNVILNKSKYQTLLDFMTMIKYFQEKIDKVNLNELFDELIEKIGYKEYLKEETENFEERNDNLQEFKSVLYQIESNSDGTSRSERLREAFDYTILSDEYLQNQKENKNGVTLSTIHSVKGLEFEYVFVVALEENIFPNEGRIVNNFEMEEERRIAYVAFTRAKSKLYLLATKNRMLYGTWFHNQPSRFLLEFAGTKKIKKQMFEEENPFHDLEQEYLMKKPSEEEQKKSGPYRTGDLVIHDKFGEGVIIGIRGEIGMIFFASQKRMTNIMLAHKALRKK